jgi:hypothetical protein
LRGLSQPARRLARATAAAAVVRCLVEPARPPCVEQRESVVVVEPRQGIGRAFRQDVIAGRAKRRVRILAGFSAKRRIVGERHGVVMCRLIWEGARVRMTCEETVVVHASTLLLVRVGLALHQLDGVPECDLGRRRNACEKCVPDDQPVCVVRVAGRGARVIAHELPL